MATNILFSVSLPHDQEFRLDQIPGGLRSNPRSYPDACRLALGEYGLKLRGNSNPYSIFNGGDQPVGEVRLLAKGPVFSWFAIQPLDDLALFTSIERHRLVQTGKTLYRPLMRWLERLATPAGPAATWLADPASWAQIQPVLKQAGIQYWAWHVALEPQQFAQQVQADPWAALTALAAGAL